MREKCISHSQEKNNKMSRIFRKHALIGVMGPMLTAPKSTPTPASTDPNLAQNLTNELLALQKKMETEKNLVSTAKNNYQQFQRSTPFTDSKVPSAVNPCNSIVDFYMFILSSEYVDKQTEYIKNLQNFSKVMNDLLAEGNKLQTSLNSARAAASITQSEFEKANAKNLIQNIKNELSVNNTELVIVNKTLKMFQITLPFKQRYVKVLARLCRAQNIKKKHDATGLKYVSDLRNLKLGYDDAIKIIKQWQAAFLSQVPKQKITSKEQAELMSESFVQAILEIETEKRKLVFERFKSTFGRK